MEKDAYEKLRTEHSTLPEYETMDALFGLKNGHSEASITEVKKAIRENFDAVISFLGGILQPDPHSMPSMFEYGCFDNAERETALDLFRKLMVLEKELFASELKHNHTQDAELIKKITTEWEDIRKKILAYVDKLKEHWKQPAKIEEMASYTG